MAGPDGLPFILAPITFSRGEWFGKGCPKPRAEWWDGVRGQDRLLCHQLRPLIVGFWALATYPHVQTCALVVSLGRPEDTQWGVHTTLAQLLYDTLAQCFERLYFCVVTQLHE